MPLSVGVLVLVLGAALSPMSSVDVSQYAVNDTSLTHTLAALPVWTRRWARGEAEAVGALVVGCEHGCLRACCVRALVCECPRAVGWSELKYVLVMVTGA